MGWRLDGESRRGWPRCHTNDKRIRIGPFWNPSASKAVTLLHTYNNQFFGGRLLSRVAFCGCTPCDAHSTRSAPGAPAPRAAFAFGSRDGTDARSKDGRKRSSARDEGGKKPPKPASRSTPKRSERAGATRVPLDEEEAHAAEAAAEEAWVEGEEEEEEEAPREEQEGLVGGGDEEEEITMA